MTSQNTQFPNLFLIGASKSGTTSIAQALSDHDDVFMAHPKEPDFFNQYDGVESIPKQQLSKYLTLYANVSDEKIVGEASVSSLASVCAAKHIYNHNPYSKIMISLRNPLERITSLYDMYVRLGLEQDFNFAAFEDPWLTRQCYYHEQVKRYLDLFDESQILIIDFEELKNDWNGTMASILNFLGVNVSHVDKPVVRNTGGTPKSSAFRIFTNRKLIYIGKKLIPQNMRNYLDFRIKKVAFEKTLLDEAQINKLVSVFEQDVFKLDQLLNTSYRTKWLNL